MGLLFEGMRIRNLYDGTFMTRDPIGYADGPNVYCYVHCNPITRFDPLGLEVKRSSGEYVATPDMSARALNTKYYEGTKKITLGQVYGLTTRTDSGIDNKVLGDRTFSLSGCLGLEVSLLDPAEKSRRNISSLYSREETKYHEEEHVNDLKNDFNKMADNLNTLDGRHLKDGISTSAAREKLDSYTKAEEEHYTRFSKEKGALHDKLDAAPGETPKISWSEYEKRLQDINSRQEEERNKVLEPLRQELIEMSDPVDDDSKKTSSN